MAKNTRGSFAGASVTASRDRIPAVSPSQAHRVCTPPCRQALFNRL